MRGFVERADLGDAVVHRSAHWILDGRIVGVQRDEAVDVTLHWDRRLDGARHPLTTTQELIADVFTSMGYEIAEGPEIETEWLSFDALNIGPDHPTRTLMDTELKDATKNSRKAVSSPVTCTS